MRAKRAFVALILCALAIVSSAAGALTESQRMLLFSGGRTSSSLAAQGNFVQASYDLNKASLDSVATFSRAGNAMQFDSSGYLTYGPNNLLTQSNAFSNAAWNNFNISVSGGVADPFGGTNASTITATANNGQFYQTPNLGAAPNGIFAVWMRRRTGTGNITFRKPDGTTPIITVTSTWTQIYGVGANTGAANVITLATSGDAIDVYAATASAVTYETTPRAQDQVITTSAAYYGPRFDYTYNGSSWVPAGLLEEEARTNLQPVSNLSASTTLNAATFTTGQAAPDGTTAARKLIADVTAGFHYATQATATTSGVLYSTSFFAYAPDAGYTLVGGASNTGAIGTFDLATGTATSGTNMAASMRQVGTLAGKPLYKCVWQWTAAANNNQAYFYAPNASNTIAALAGNGTSGVVIWGVQTEAGAKDTSLIVTNGAAVTRAPDILSLSGAALTAASGPAATLIAEYDAVNISFAVSNAVFFGTTGGIGLLRETSTTNLQGNSAALNSKNFTVPAGTFTSTFRAGVAYDGTGFTIGANGSVSASVLAFTPPSTVYVGNLNGATNYSGNNHLRSLAVYNSRLPSATLQAKSVVGASYAANDNGIRYAFADNDNLPVHWRVAL